MPASWHSAGIPVGGGKMLDDALYEAVREGDPDLIRTVLDDGADVRYVRPKGYTVLIDAMFGGPPPDHPHLLDVLRLLIARGAELDTASEYGVSALSVASRLGRFDAV